MLVQMEAVGTRRQLSEVGDQLQPSSSTCPEGELTQGGSYALLMQAGDRHDQRLRGWFGISSTEPQWCRAKAKAGPDGNRC
ncbi:MAG: hypothetical protein ACKOCM_03655 [Cyanobacteriota bacterium]